MPQAEEPELFRVEPDRRPLPPPDAGIPSWPFGSYAPMGFYRPAPIVDFTRTVLVQFLLNLALQAVLGGAPAILTVACCTVLALVLARRAFTRWLPLASTVWKVATVAALVLNLLFVSFVTLARGCGPGKLERALEQAAIDRSAAGEGCHPSLDEMLFPYGETPA